jgi:hypothetical protein
MPEEHGNIPPMRNEPPPRPRRAAGSALVTICAELISLLAMSLSKSLHHRTFENKRPPLRRPLLICAKRQWLLVAPSRPCQSRAECRILKIYGFIPIGVRNLHFQRIDHDNFEILTLENDPLVKSWKHAISIKPLGQDRSIYRGHRYRRRQTDRLSVGMGRLVLQASPTPLARARKVLV